jgi:hypothetical protein
LANELPTLGTAFEQLGWALHYQYHASVLLHQLVRGALKVAAFIGLVAVER